MKLGGAGQVAQAGRGPRPMQAAPSRRLVQRRRARVDSPRQPGRVLDRVQVGLAGRVHKAG